MPWLIVNNPKSNLVEPYFASRAVYRKLKQQGRKFPDESTAQMTCDRINASRRLSGEAEEPVKARINKK